MANINIPIISTYNDKGAKAAARSFKALGKQSSALGASIKAAMLPAAAAVAGLAIAGVSAAKAAIEDQNAQALLANQLRQTTKATDGQIAATEDFIAKTALATGIADDELRPAFASLVRSTRSVTKSQKLMNIAIDAARGTGKPLAFTVQAISRAYGGNVRALARLDPSLKQYITKTTTADQATSMLARNFSGAAKVAAETYQGRMERLQVAFGEAKESLGMVLLPVIERFVSFVTNKVLPKVDEFIKALEEDGLGGAWAYVAGKTGEARQATQKYIDNATGWQGFMIDFAGTVLAFWAAWKGFSILAGIVTAIGTLQTALGTLGGVFTVFASSSIGAILGALGLAVIGVYTLISALRDPFFRATFGEAIINGVKGIANVFIFAYKTIRAGINPMVSLLRRLPGFGGLGFLPDVDFQQFSFDARQYQAPAMESRAGAPGVTINVNGGDPQATVDAITRWYRQNGANAPWMG